jgi:DNA modification methylase
MISNELKIVNKQIADLNFAYYNPRKMSKEQQADLRNSLQGFGVVQPAVVNINEKRYNVVIGGEQRIRVAKKLGEKSFPCVEVNLDLEREKELNVKLNKISGDWDLEKLRDNFDFTQLINLGFDAVEIKAEEKKKETIGNDVFLESVPKKARSKKGDLYEINDHRLLCGDSTLRGDVDRLFGTEKSRLIFTSPPYNIKGKMYAEYRDTRTDDEFILFNINVLLNWKRILKGNGFVFWNMGYNVNSGSTFLEVFYHFIKNSGMVFLEDIVWDKGTGRVLMDQLTRQYEHILVLNESLENIRYFEHFGLFGMKRIPLLKDKQRSLTNYWKFDTIGAQSENFKAAFPVALPLRAMDITTEIGEVVAEPFGGSGTTMIAAEKIGRRAFLMELDPQACDLILTRFTQWSRQNDIPVKIKLNGNPLEWKPSSQGESVPEKINERLLDQETK